MALPPLRANRANIDGRRADAGGLARDQAVNGFGEPLAEMIGDMGDKVDVLTKGACLFPNLDPSERDAGRIAVVPSLQAVAEKTVAVNRMKVRPPGRGMAPVDRGEDVQGRAVSDGELFASLAFSACGMVIWPCLILARFSEGRRTRIRFSSATTARSIMDPYRLGFLHHRHS